MQTMKKLAEKYLSDRMFELLSRIVLRIQALGVFSYDRHRFLKNYSKSPFAANKKQLEARLIFHAHSVEKGLSHEVLRHGFGQRPLKRLSTAMRAYNQNNFDVKDPAYRNALSVVQSYIEAHEDAGKSPELIDKYFDGIDLKSTKSNIGGVLVFNETDKKDNKRKDYKELFENRYSVREFSDNPVNKKLVENAISISMKTPSICNRQAFQVVTTADKSIIEKALKIQGGMRGYKTPPFLMTVLTDSQNFVEPTERNQAYVDGGSFSMSLLMSLEYEGLAACPLNAMFTVKQDKAMRKLLDIKPSENIIMFIAVGSFKNQNKVPKSFRYSSKDIIRTVGKS